MTTEIMPRPPYPIPDLWYECLIDELKDLITEVEFTSRWTLIEGYHSLGFRILQENDNFERAKIYGQDIVQRIAESLQKRPRTIYYAIQFAKTYPDLNLLPEGKNTSWHHIVNKYLTPESGKSKKLTITTLLGMLREIKELLEHEWQIAHQEKVRVDAIGEYTQIEKYPARMKCDFIRYLQDQVNKITSEAMSDD